MEAGEGGWSIGYMDADPAKERIREFRALGIGIPRLAELTGLYWRHLAKIESCNKITGKTMAKLFSIDLPSAPHRVAAPAARVPAIGTVRRLRALIAMGYTCGEIAEHVGTSLDVVSKASRRGKDFTEAHFALRVENAFSRLQLIPAPDTHFARQARHRAAGRGWHPPLAWDEESIDDPNAEPQTPTRSKQSEWSETYEELRGMGLVEERIAERMGLSRASLMQHLRRLEAA